ncbi:MAG: domain nuclease [Phenylobacterium sp.]|nr:domain nuclease [Phenylobacterium sp.]
MTLVDSSVWIDYFRDLQTPTCERLESLLSVEQLIIGDLILTEVLQGCVAERDFRRVLNRLGALTVIRIADEDIAVASARNYRRLRAEGVTVRKTIDCLIATRCIADGHSLLYSDRDFDPFVQYLGLQSANPPAKA